MGEGNSTLITAIQLSTLAIFFALVALGESVATGTFSASNFAPAELTSFIQDLPWKQVLWTGLISTAGTLWIEVEALRSVPASDAALVYTTEPVWGAILSWALLGEVMTKGSYVGAAFILLGSLVGQSGGAHGGDGHGGDGHGGKEEEGKEKTA